MIRTLSRIALVAAVVATGGIALAGSHSGNPAVNARKALMNLRTHYVVTLGDMASGKTEYDAEKATAAANSLSLLSKDVDQSAMWPAGSSNAELGDETGALPVIWSTYPAIMDKAKAMNEASDAMVQAAGTDLASLKGALQTLGKACTACHDDYRKPWN